MGMEQWTQEEVHRYVHHQAQNWFYHLLNPLSAPYGTPIRHFTIRSFLEIVPSTIHLPRWPNRAWSVIGDVENQESVGMMLGSWYDHGDHVDLLEFYPLHNPINASTEALHQELLLFVNSLEESFKKPMSRASRKRWSQLDHRYFTR